MHACIYVSIPVFVQLNVHIQVFTRLARAQIQDLAVSDARLLAPLGADMAAGALDEATVAVQSAQTVMAQFNLALAHLCTWENGMGGERRGGVEEEAAAAALCREVFGKIALVTSLCSDGGAAGRTLWCTMLSAAASALVDSDGVCIGVDGVEGLSARTPAVWRAGGGKGGVSPWVLQVFVLLRGGRGGLYDILPIHCELLPALVDLLTQTAETLLREWGRDLVQTSEDQGCDAAVAWGCNTLVALRQAVRKNRERKTAEGKKKEKKDGDRKRDHKRQEAIGRVADEDGENVGGEVAAGCGEGTSAVSGALMERPTDGIEDAVLDVCEAMWKTHPSIRGLQMNREGGPALMRAGSRKREKGKGAGATASVCGVGMLTALIEIVGQMPAEMLTGACQQALLLALAALDPLVIDTVSDDKDVSGFRLRTRALLASHLVSAAASGTRGHAQSSVAAWLLADASEVSGTQAVSDTCEVLHAIGRASCASSIATPEGGQPVAGGACAVPPDVIVGALKPYLVDGVSGGREALPDTGGFGAKRGRTQTAVGGEWGRCVRGCALVGGMVSAFVDQEWRGGGDVKDKRLPVHQDVAPEIAQLMTELEAIVVRAWRATGDEEGREGAKAGGVGQDRGLRRGLIAALAAHVLRYYAARRGRAEAKFQGGSSVVKLVGAILGHSMRVLLNPSEGDGSRGGDGEGQGRCRELEELRDECSRHFILTVCASMGHMKPVLREEGYRLVLAILLAPRLRMSEGRRAACIKELLHNSARHHVAVMTKAVLGELREQTTRASALTSLGFGDAFVTAGADVLGSEQEEALLQRVRATVSLVRSSLTAMTPHSRRWGPMLPQLPNVIANISALVTCLVQRPLHAAATATSPAAVTVDAARAAGGGREWGLVTGAARGPSDDALLSGAERSGRESRLLAAEPGGMAPRWQAAVSAAKVVALALQRSDAIELDTRGVQCALETAVSLLSAMAAAGLAVPGAETAGAELGGLGGDMGWEVEEDVGGEYEGGFGYEGGRNLRRRQVWYVLAARRVERGCVVIEAVTQVLLSIVLRRTEELPSVIPSVMKCMSVYLEWLIILGTHYHTLLRGYPAAAAMPHHSGRVATQDAEIGVCVEQAVESARNFGRLLTEMSKNKKRFNKYAPHLLLAFVAALDRHPAAWPEELKSEAMQGIYAVLEMCGKHELQQVHGLLTPSSRPLFQGLYEDFKRSYKYTGEA